MRSGTSCLRAGRPFGRTARGDGCSDQNRGENDRDGEDSSADVDAQNQEGADPGPDQHRQHRNQMARSHRQIPVPEVGADSGERHGENGRRHIRNPEMTNDSILDAESNGADRDDEELIRDEQGCPTREADEEGDDEERQLDDERVAKELAPMAAES